MVDRWQEKSDPSKKALTTLLFLTDALLAFPPFTPASYSCSFKTIVTRIAHCAELKRACLGSRSTGKVETIFFFEGLASSSSRRCCTICRWTVYRRTSNRAKIQKYADHPVTRRRRFLLNLSCARLSNSIVCFGNSTGQA